MDSSEGSSKGELCPGILWGIMWFLILWLFANFESNVLVEFEEVQLYY
jgi:hypothetical protein